MPSKDSAELCELGENADPKLKQLINACVNAAKKVETDGTSYRHMPDWFEAIGAVQAHTAAQVAAAVLDARKQDYAFTLDMSQEERDMYYRVQMADAHFTTGQKEAE